LCQNRRISTSAATNAILLLAVAITACGTPRDSHVAARDSHIGPILLFTGTGTSPGDVAALEAVLNANHLDYATADSAGLNAMDEEGIRRYRLLIVPGGNFVEIGNGLSSGTIANVRTDVRNGLNYLGICAGAFLAGHFPQPYKSLNLTSGVQFGFYAAARQGIRKTVVEIAIAGGPTLDQYWEDGPQLTGWGAAVATYPDGTPAVVEGSYGAGWIVLTGIHPEAPESWRRGMAFSTPSTTDQAFAATLIHAALDRTSLPHF
jgi:hypothetical protein